MIGVLMMMPEEGVVDGMMILRMVMMMHGAANLQLMILTTTFLTMMTNLKSKPKI